MGSRHRLHIHPLSHRINIIFGVMKLVNFAHGQLLMLGAYIAFAVLTGLNLNTYLTSIGLNVYLSIPIAIVAVALVGIVVERLTFNRVRGKEKLTEIFLSLGLISVFENIVILWQGFGLHQITSPFQGQKSSVGTIAISYDWLFAVGFVIVTLVLLLVMLKKTKIGLAIRATSQKGEVATLMGIDIKQIYIFTFALGAALAGAAGALYGMVFSFDPYVGAFPNNQSVCHHHSWRIWQHTGRNNWRLTLRNCRDHRGFLFGRHMAGRNRVCHAHCGPYY